MGGVQGFGAFIAALLFASYLLSCFFEQTGSGLLVERYNHRWWHFPGVFIVAAAFGLAMVWVLYCVGAFFVWVIKAL